MTFGTLSYKYFNFPPEINDMDKASAYVVNLDKNKRYITELSNQYQQELVLKRHGNVTESNQNIYLPGELILLRLDPSKHKPNKLHPKFEGPYVVIEHKRNNIKCRHVTKDEVFDFHNDDVKLFIGDMAAAKVVAQLDGNHYNITSFDKHYGDPEHRSTMNFLITFADGEQLWKPWLQELFQTVQKPTSALTAPSTHSSSLLMPSLRSKLRPTKSLSLVYPLVTASTSTSASTITTSTSPSPCPTTMT